MREIAETRINSNGIYNLDFNDDKDEGIIDSVSCY